MMDSLPIAALQHMAFCPRQCALIHVEHVWAENELTVGGKLLHERSDAGGSGRERGRKVARSVHLYSKKYGIHGIADVVEYVRGEGRNWIPMPVEYKHGKPKKGREDEIQLCAQALCLEEMHGVPLQSGELFYGKIRRRQEILLDDDLRTLTMKTILELRAMLKQGRTPVIPYSSKCERCSLKELCLPRAGRLIRGVSAWNGRCMEEALSSMEPGDDLL